MPPLAAEYGPRVFMDGDEPAYDALFRLAWPETKTLLHTRQHALEGGFLVVEHEETGELVGSCVAFAPETPSHAANGSLGWLVVDPAHGGRRIGRWLAASVTNRLLEERYPLPWLGTEDDRVAAIHLYLSLGWEPHLYTDGMAERWQSILTRLHGDQPA